MPLRYHIDLTSVLQHCFSRWHPKTSFGFRLGAAIGNTFERLWIGQIEFERLSFWFLPFASHLEGCGGTWEAFKAANNKLKIKRLLAAKGTPFEKSTPIEAAKQMWLWFCIWFSLSTSAGAQFFGIVSILDGSAPKHKTTLDGVAGVRWICCLLDQILNLSITTAYSNAVSIRDFTQISMALCHICDWS